MKHTHDTLRDRLLAKAGLSPLPKAKYRLEDLERTEWSPRFERLMRNRMLMGALRYGPMEHERKVGSKWDLVGAMEKKIALYRQTGNTEYLVDLANYCLLEFELGHHPTKHWAALDNHHDHCRLKKEGQ